MDLKRLNEQRYGKPPTLTKIQGVIKRSGLSMRKFELFFGIPRTTIKQVLQGKRPLPTIYWHIFYERRAAKFLKVFKAGKAWSVETILGDITPQQILREMPEDRRAELVSLIKSMELDDLLTPSIKEESHPNEHPQPTDNIAHDALLKFKKNG